MIQGGLRDGLYNIYMLEWRSYSSWTQWFFVIPTTSNAHYTNDQINLIELNPLILLASSTTDMLSLKYLKSVIL
jgi:hypothetical protein